MTMEGNWIRGAMRNDYPDVEYTVAELPEGPAGKGTLLFTQCWGIAAESPNQAAAVDLVEYLTTPEQQLAVRRRVRRHAEPAGRPGGLRRRVPRRRAVHRRWRVRPGPGQPARPAAGAGGPGLPAGAARDDYPAADPRVVRHATPRPRSSSETPAGRTHAIVRPGPPTGTTGSRRSHGPEPGPATDRHTSAEPGATRARPPPPPGPPRPAGPGGVGVRDADPRHPRAVPVHPHRHGAVGVGERLDRPGQPVLRRRRVRRARQLRPAVHRAGPDPQRLHDEPAQQLLLRAAGRAPRRRCWHCSWRRSSTTSCSRPRASSGRRSTSRPSPARWPSAWCSCSCSPGRARSTRSWPTSASTRPTWFSDSRGLLHLLGDGLGLWDAQSPPECARPARRSWACRPGSGSPGRASRCR